MILYLNRIIHCSQHAKKCQVIFDPILTSAVVADVTAMSVINWVLFFLSQVSVKKPFCPHTACFHFFAYRASVLWGVEMISSPTGFSRITTSRTVFSGFSTTSHC